MVTNKGLKWILEQLVSVWQGTPVNEAIFLELFTDPFSLAPETEMGDVEVATFPGYGAQELDNWQSPAIVPGDQAWTPEITHVFTCSAIADETINGWLARTAGGLLLFGKNLPLPQHITDAGQIVRVLPTLLAISFTPV